VVCLLFVHLVQAKFLLFMRFTHLCFSSLAYWPVWR
jgi:hypothetical protein